MSTFGAAGGVPGGARGAAGGIPGGARGGVRSGIPGGAPGGVGSWLAGGVGSCRSPGREGDWMNTRAINDTAPALKAVKVGFGTRVFVRVTFCQRSTYVHVKHGSAVRTREGEPKTAPLKTSGLICSSMTTHGLPIFTDAVGDTIGQHCHFV